MKKGCIKISQNAVSIQHNISKLNERGVATDSIFIEKKFREQLQKIHRPTSRLLKAFPDLKIPFNEELEMIRKWVIKNNNKNKKN